MPELIPDQSIVRLEGSQGVWPGRFDRVLELSMQPENEDWILTTPKPGIYLVRFVQPMLNFPAGEATGLTRWRALSDSVEAGKVLILNFLGVRYLNSQFLRSLIEAYKTLSQREARIVACHLCEQLQECFMVVGPRQPLDFMLNYVESEAQAIEKARRFLQGNGDPGARDHLSQ